MEQMNMQENARLVLGLRAALFAAPYANGHVH